MDAEALLTSAVINIGLALVILSLFSVLKKQPCAAPVYFSRRMAGNENLPLDRRFSLNRLRPSISWIYRAIRISEDEILCQCGLDALVVLRLFKFGIRFFSVCTLIGLLILVPINFYSQSSLSMDEVSSSMDYFTISNVEKGSNRLWVHFSCLCFISFYILYLLYQEYKGILDRRMQHIANQRHRVDQFTVLVRGIPICAEHKARGCSVEHFFSKHHPYTYQSYQIVHDGKDVEELLHLASSIAQKVKQLQETTTNKQNRSSMICHIFQPDTRDREIYEEELQEVCQKIRRLQCEIILRQKELPAAFVSFKTRWGATLAAQTQQHVHPLLWITEFAPEPRDVIWNNLAIPYRLLVLQKIAVFVAAFLLIVFFTIPVTAVQGIVKFEKLKIWFPPARAVQLIPGLSSILTGYLPSAILNVFIYLIPYAMLAMGSLEGDVSNSKKEIKACSMVFYFLVGNVFFLSLLSGSLLDQIGESVTHPKDFPSHLARAVSDQSDFFITYILTDGLSGFSLEALQLGLLLWHIIKSCTFGRSKTQNPFLFGFPYYRVIPTVSLAILIGMVYAVVAPLLLPFLIVYFILGYVVYVNQMQDVYEIIYETHGQYWPCIHHYIFINVVLMQITMIGLFGLKSKPGASISTIFLLLLTLLFNEYCKLRFLPTFCHWSIQEETNIHLFLKCPLDVELSRMPRIVEMVKLPNDVKVMALRWDPPNSSASSAWDKNAMENDERDEVEGQMEANRDRAAIAYQPPWMRPVSYTHESASTQPLVPA